MEVLPTRTGLLKGKNYTGSGEYSLRSPTRKHSYDKNLVPDNKISQQKFMAVYKVNECKKKFNHDKRQCLNWHSQSDRRRNPFHIGYTTTEVIHYLISFVKCCGMFPVHFYILGNTLFLSSVRERSLLQRIQQVPVRA